MNSVTLICTLTFVPLKDPINAPVDYSNCYYNPNYKAVCHRLKFNQGIDQVFKSKLKYDPSN